MGGVMPGEVVDMIDRESLGCRLWEASGEEAGGRGTAVPRWAVATTHSWKASGCEGLPTAPGPTLASQSHQALFISPAA